jgi:hypothetical protein
MRAHREHRYNFVEEIKSEKRDWLAMEILLVTAFGLFISGCVALVW